MKKFLQKFRYGEKGFTLIELLVVIAILGILAAVAVPNIGKFIGQGKQEAADTETHNIQTAVLAAMADASVSVVSEADNYSATQEFGPGDDCVVSGAYDVGDYITGGAADVQGTYSIEGDGEVNRLTYPGL